MISIEAINARRAVLSLLSNSSGERIRSTWLELAPKDPTVWDFFLRTERCAIAVRAKIAEFNLADITQPEVLKVIKSRARLELQKVLSGIEQLQNIANIAKRENWKVVVLKGGLLLESGGQIDLHDIDILMSEESGNKLSKMLDETGYSAKDASDANPCHHLSPRFRDDTVAIEIHRSVKGLQDADNLLSNAIPIRNNSNLWSLSRVEHIFHLLIHATIQHPDRRGTIRDICLISHAIQACNPEELEIISGRIRAHTKRDILESKLNLALSFIKKEPIEDTFEGMILRKYVLIERYASINNNLINRAVRFMCGDETLRTAIMTDLKMPTHVTSRFSPLNTLHKNASWAASSIRQLLRISRISLAMLVSAHNAWETKRLIRRYS